MKEHYSAKKKKIRGWKRRIEQVEKWGKRIERPDLKYFNKVGDYTYDRCILYPFYVFEKRQPPLWFYKLIVAKFIKAYFLWDEVFQKLNVPYDLQLWIYDPHYMWSEIICRRVEKPGDLNGYSSSTYTVKPFPHQKFIDGESRASELEWLLADEEAVIFEYDFEDYETTESEVVNDGYVKHHHSEEHGFYFAKKIGNVWVGRKRAI
jgi:hypothetical protein